MFEFSDLVSQDYSQRENYFLFLSSYVSSGLEAPRRFAKQTRGAVDLGGGGGAEHPLTQPPVTIR